MAGRSSQGGKGRSRSPERRTPVRSGTRRTAGRRPARRGRKGGWLARTGRRLVSLGPFFRRYAMAGWVALVLGAGGVLGVKVWDWISATGPLPPSVRTAAAPPPPAQDPVPPPVPVAAPRAPQPAPAVPRGAPPRLVEPDRDAPLPQPRPPEPLVVVDQPRPAPPPAASIVTAMTVPPGALRPAPAPPIPASPAGRPAWQANAVPAPPADGRPRIAIVIDDVGVSKRDVAGVLDLPGPITVSVMTYADGAATLAARARSAGHEVMLHVPMQPEGRADPGPNALLVGLEPQELERRIVWNLDRVPGIVGINNHMGSRFTADRWAMAQVMVALKGRGLMFLDSRTSAATQGQAAADQAGVPAVSRDVFLDDDMKADRIDAQLALTEARARAQGTAIAIGHPHPATVAALRRWLPQLQAKGLQLVPVTAILRQRQPGLPPS
ncbi:divergent polysaccharide deacetylase family protein [Zavarzinia sp. CC-PAN008]|uniref:divergent polysaccharide deacetylase family protein n=1 Tax=Zavarzinia sp. CC-PAN008 TaxID=3243332 RepID=UPI003F743379